MTSTPENQSCAVEQLRGDGQSASDIEISELEVRKDVEKSAEEMSSEVNNVTIPCSNPFEVLANLSDMDGDDDVEDVEPVHEHCPRCKHQLKSISSFPQFPVSSTGINGYSCGHRDFKPDTKTYACEGCRILMCNDCLGKESFLVSLKENDMILSNLKA